ncbi:syntaxin-binding protein 5 isoform X4 [Syngnathoides biaculeatus]|uniref:syntaxin-binding protein 5 isoform X4 n=1 Tax=Syngnathoides biaculeatus TaxID=300417 RepID=UPI002ADE1D02|nr:syntaxin-binding protein 5 isoform X4 [Syngnathoides biaculeatus]
MKKFNIRKVLDGLTAVSSSSSSSAAQTGAAKENDAVPESLQSEHFQLCKTVRHGFPHQPSSMAFDPVQKILAVGTLNGALRLFGRAGVECYCQHESGAAVIQLQFLINEGAVVSALADDSIHLWNLRQKIPAVLHSLKFNRERITYCHLPFQSKWLYIGTERGNIHIVNVESFTLSGYVIMWNKAIELSTKTHPGPVVHISDNPMDEGKLLIGFECGVVVLWDLKSKKADYRYNYDEAIHSVAWHHEGKQFVCSHSDGTLTTWNIRTPAKPAQITTPHGKQPKDGKKPEPCKPILKVEYKTTRAGDPFMVLSGGLSYDTVGRRACLTVMHGKSTAVLEMDFPIVDFLTLCETPYPNDFQEPYAVVVLLERDLIVIDLGQIGYPIFETPYPLSIHESPVTCCEYFADCPAELIPALYSVGTRQKRQGYSKKDWPVSGGNWGQGTQSYPEIIITGHADGSIKFWDASALMLQVLYKLKTAKVFERARGKDEKANTDIVDEDPFAIQTLCWCPESRMLCVAGVSAHVIVYRFSKQEITTADVQLLEVRMQCDPSNLDSPDAAGDQTPTQSSPVLPSPQETEPPATASGQPSAVGNTSSSSADGLRDNMPCLKVRVSPLKQSPGYQVELVVQLVWVSGEPPQQITSLAINSSYGLVVFGNTNGLAVVDYLQKTLLLNLGTSELHSPSEPIQRQPCSPRKARHPSGALCDSSDGPNTAEERCKSPNSARMSRKISSSSEQKPNSDWGTISSRKHFYHTHNGTSKTTRKSVKLAFPPRNSDHNMNSKDNLFSRSRSSSVTSIDRESREAICAFCFCETFPRKLADASPGPCLLVGTTHGAVMLLSLSVPSGDQQRLLQSVEISSSGMVTKLKGGILTLGLLDAAGAALPAPYEAWYDPNASDEEKEKEKSRWRRPASPPSSHDGHDSQFAVLCSEKQAKVLAMPSQTRVYKHSITESSFVLRADVVEMAGVNCIACFCANGHIMMLSLPSLRPLLDVNYLPLTDMRIARTFCFSNLGQALYLTSPTEVQRITYSQDTCDNLQEMLSELFTPVETPEAPNRGFFKGLFGGGAQSLDREDLFGETGSGKASRTLAQHIPGPGNMEGMKGAASGVVGDLARARIALDERGQKLGELEERTAAMMASADSFSKHAHDMMLKYKDKKWYQL